MAPLIKPHSTLCAVPLHWKRQWTRGYNQSQLIVEQLRRLDPTLKTTSPKQFRRIRPTKQQALLTKKDRQNNLKNAFNWTGLNPPPKEVVLIDDILTTGSTVKSAALALRKAGTQKVSVVTFAHG